MENRSWILSLTIILSLLLHFGLGVGIQLFPVQIPEKNASRDIDVEILNPEEAQKIIEQSKNKQMFVREALAPDEVKDENSKSLADYLSAKRQRVLQEVRAQQNGKTQNSKPNLNQPWQNKVSPSQSQASNKKDGKKEQTADNQKNLEKSPDGYVPFQVPKEFARFSQQQGSHQVSTIGEDLPKQLSIGSFTALNTDRFDFYSFYARVEDLIRFRWETNVQNALDSFDQSFLKGVVGRKDRWVTQVEFWLLPDGRYHSAHILKESGIQKFDLAAVQAFRDANFFPNPNKEMINPQDGYIHLFYSFTVNYTPPVMVRQ